MIHPHPPSFNPHTHLSCAPQHGDAASREHVHDSHRVDSRRVYPRGLACVWGQLLARAQRGRAAPHRKARIETKSAITHSHSHMLTHNSSRSSTCTSSRAHAHTSSHVLMRLNNTVVRDTPTCTRAHSCASTVMLVVWVSRSVIRMLLCTFACAFACACAYFSLPALTLSHS
jgi:hypothetical protein